MNKPVTTDLKPDVDGIFIKVTDVPDAQTFLPQHSHTYDHVSFIATGATYIEEQGETKVLRHVTAPAMVTIKAGVKHLFLTTEPNTRICCIHRIDRTGVIDIEGDDSF